MGTLGGPRKGGRGKPVDEVLSAAEKSSETKSSASQANSNSFEVI